MIMKKSFYFIRHGETDFNKQHIVAGSFNIDINDEGIRQAEKARLLFEDIQNIGDIYCSPLQRASHTASIINKSFGKTIKYIDDLAERSWGEWETKPKPKLDCSMSDLPEKVLPKGAETFDNFSSRVVNAVNNILKNCYQKPLIVAHAGVFVVLKNAANLRKNEIVSASNAIPYLFNFDLQLKEWKILELVKTK